nr:ComEC/Rec2 family competence protein [Clostridia bacterium]
MKRLINFRPAAFAIVGVVSGIIFSYCILLHAVWGAVLSAITAIFLFVVFTFFSSANFKGAGRALCLFVFILCAAIGGVGFYRAAEGYEKADLGGHTLNISGRVSEISENENYTLVLLTDLHFSGAITGKSYYNLLATVYGENAYVPGAELKFTAVVRDRTLIYNGKFASSALLGKVKYSCEVNSSDISITGSNPTLFQTCNTAIKNALQSGLSEEEFSVAYAMLTGNSDYMTEETVNAYRSVGVAHIFAVSGLHIGFLATAIYFMLSKLKVNRAVAFIIALSICIFYSGVCGFSASSVRAVIMFFFLNIARLFGLKYDGISAVCAAALCILIFSPVQLFCVGFQMSFSIVATVIVLYNPLKKALKFLPDKLAAALTVSFLAEVGGIPVLLYAFGEFAALSLIVNMLFIPLAGIIFIALIICTALSLFFAPAVCLFLPEYALVGLNFIVRALSFKTLLIGGFTLGAFSAAYYGAIIVSGGLINFRTIVKTSVAAALIVVCIIGTVALNISNAKKVYATVIGSENLSAVFMTAGEQNVLVISDMSYRTFSQYRLSGATARADGKSVSVVLLKQEQIFELPAVVNRLNGVINIERLYYCGERDEDAEAAVSAAFKGLKAVNMSDGDEFYFGNGNCKFALDGKCLLCTVNGRTTAILARFNGLGYDGLNAAVHTAVCFDCHGGIQRAYAPKRMVSFRAEYGYSDGETFGNLNLTLG